MFLNPPFRKPYELYYFCNLAEEVIIVTDHDTYSKYCDWFDEFKAFNYKYVFISIEIQGISKLFRFSSTAALINYDETQISKIIKDKNITTIVSVEIFSSLSVQASRLSLRFSLKHIVIVWENIKKSLLYLLPPFSINTKIVKSNANKFIAVSNISKESILSLSINENKIETVYPGILINRFNQSNDSIDKILFVGNLEPYKGVDILLQTFKKLANYFFDVKLVIVGNGSLESKIMKMKSSGLKIEYRGYFPHSNLPIIYSECSIFCSPVLQVKRAGLILTSQAQFEFTLVEAMASGLPIVSSNIGAIPEIIGSQNFIVSPKIDTVLAALYRLLTCDDLRRKLRYKNRERSMCRFNALTQSLLFDKAINRE